MSDPELDALLTKAGRKPVTYRSLSVILNGLLAELGKRLRDQQAQIAALEAKREKDGDPWQKGGAYARGDIVQYDGSWWKCTEAHIAGTSFSHECFRLTVKRGRDAR